jgi:flagellar biosynthesis/type III secretory pathway protein FliH
MKTIEELIRQTINNKNPIPITHTAFFEVASIEKALKEAFALGIEEGYEKRYYEKIYETFRKVGEALEKEETK